MRRPGDDEEAPPGGRAAQRLLEQLRDRFGDDRARWPQGAREQVERATQEGLVPPDDVGDGPARSGSPL